ncbi:hypothetical protein EJ08DRAFT_664430 [Tothia fuscella]|uniref:Uncharacterized protein n=1 Tax=Tothia fuscella TaxID=1048955 RepID=A0A9P4NIP5_9PEZI|nr:hypothetical protein EJ08DRAFT_664430 [Tothia fuscella]
MCLHLLISPTARRSKRRVKEGTYQVYIEKFPRRFPKGHPGYVPKKKPGPNGESPYQPGEAIPAHINPITGKWKDPRKPRAAFVCRRPDEHDKRHAKGELGHRFFAPGEVEGDEMDDIAGDEAAGRFDDGGEGAGGGGGDFGDFGPPPGRGGVYPGRGGGYARGGDGYPARGGGYPGGRGGYPRGGGYRGRYARGRGMGYPVMILMTYDKRKRTRRGSKRVKEGTHHVFIQQWPPKYPPGHPTYVPEKEKYEPGDPLPAHFDTVTGKPKDEKAYKKRRPAIVIRRADAHDEKHAKRELGDKFVNGAWTPYKKAYGMEWRGGRAFASGVVGAKEDVGTKEKAPVVAEPVPAPAPAAAPAPVPPTAPPADPAPPAVPA